MLSTSIGLPVLPDLTGMQMKEWTLYSEGDLAQDLDDVLSSDLELFPSLNFLNLDEDLIAQLEEEIDFGDLDDISDVRELRNHDCMWAGLCVNEKHERDSVRPEKVIMPAPQKKKPVVAPTNSRSLLLPARPPPERPDTPLSENELDFDFGSILGDMLEVLPPVGPTEVTGQVCRPPVPLRVYTAQATSDHCYFSTIVPDSAVDPVKTDCLGVQTPSDSEEEIDVETVVAETRKTGSRSSSSSSTGLPTTPTLLDRHHLQLTVASAMSSKGKRGTSPRYVLDRTMDERRPRATTRKRRLSTSDECAGDFGRKSVKRKQYRKHKGGRSKKRRRMYIRHSGSSDSEFDSTERRSLHNNMERQRRIDLRNAFEELRVLLPDTRDNEKAAKVVILNSGAQYCEDLMYMEQKFIAQKNALRRHQEGLRDEVSRLRRSLYARR